MSQRHPRTARRAPAVLAAAIAAAANARADTHYWVAGSGYWDEAVHWSLSAGGAGGAGQPINLDNAYLWANTDTIVYRDVYCPSYTYPGLALLDVNGTSGALVTLTQTANTLYADTEVIGSTGRGRFTQTAGANFSLFNLYVARQGLSQGTYNLSGDTSQFGTQRGYIGAASGAIGLFNQTGGTAQFDFDIYLGQNSGQGKYQLSGGTLTSYNLWVGAGGTGTFLQSGGIATISVESSIARTAASVGVQTLNGGTFIAKGYSSVGGDQYGAGGSGTLQLNGGWYTAEDGLRVYPGGRVVQAAAATLQSGGHFVLDGGRYTASASSMQLASGRRVTIGGGGTMETTAEWVVPAGTGVSITNGNLTVADWLDIGMNSVGTLLASGTNSVVATTNPLYGYWGFGSGDATVSFANGAIGAIHSVNLGRDGGYGTLLVSTGAQVNFTSLELGIAGGIGTVILSDVGSSLGTGAHLVLGNGGTASYSQTGGTSTVGYDVIIGKNATSAGRLSVSAGTFAAGRATYVGGDASAAGGVGTLIVSGSSTYNSAGGIVIYPGGRIQHPGGWIISNGDVVLNGGRIDKTGGTLSVGNGHKLSIQSGGVVAVTGTHGVSPGSTLQVNNGTFSTTAYLDVAPHSNTGTLIVDGASARLIAGGGSYWGAGSMAFATINFANAAVGTLGSVFLARDQAVATFNVQSDADVTIGGMFVGGNGGVGVINLSGSGTTLRIGGSSGFTLGDSGTGTVNINGGDFYTSTGTTTIGSDGTVRINGGSFHLYGPMTIQGGDVVMSSGGLSMEGGTSVRITNDGRFVVPGGLNYGAQTITLESAGVLQVGGLLSMGHPSGYIAINGGRLSVGSLSNAGGGTVNLTAGTLHFSGAAGYTLSPTAPLGSSMTLEAGKSLMVSYTLTLDPSAQLNVTGGRVSADAAVNNGRYVQSAGTSSLGNFDNSITGAGSLQVTGGLVLADRVRQSLLSISGTGSVATWTSGPTVANSRVNSLIFGGSIGAWQGEFDLAGNALIIDYSGGSPLYLVHDYLVTGYHSGSWNGNGINSSLAAATPGTALGYAEATSLFGTFPATYRGESIDNTSLLISYTLSGDANLDRTVTIADFARLAAKFNQSASWVDGDFNYDGMTGIGDFSLLASRFNQALAIDASGSPVPEPVLGVAAMIGLFGITRPRRRERS